MSFSGRSLHAMVTHLALEAIRVRLRIYRYWYRKARTESGVSWVLKNLRTSEAFSDSAQHFSV